MDARYSDCMYLNKFKLLFVRLSRSLEHYIDLNTNAAIGLLKKTLPMLLLNND